MTVYRVKLTVQEPERVLFEGRDTFRVQIIASDAENMADGKIFGFQKTLVDPGTVTQQDEFCFVCSVFDLSAYAADAPNVGQDPPFFRKASIDVYLPSVTKADEFITEVRTQVDELITALKNMDELQTESTWHPDAPTTTTTTPAPGTTTTSTTTTTTTTSTTTTTAAPEAGTAGLLWTDTDAIDILNLSAIDGSSGASVTLSPSVGVIWDVTTDQHFGRSYAVGISGITMFDSDTGLSGSTIATPGSGGFDIVAPKSIDFDPVNRKLYVGGENAEGQAEIWRLDSGGANPAKVLTINNSGGFVQSLAVHYEQNRLYVDQLAVKGAVYTLSTPTFLKYLPGTGDARDLHIDRTNNKLYYPTGFNGSVLRRVDSLDATGLEDFAGLLDEVWRVAVRPSTGHVFLLGRGTGEPYFQIVRVDLDGTNKVVLRALEPVGASGGFSIYTPGE